MLELTAECCCHQQLELGEGVRWIEGCAELAWVDLHRGRLYTAPLVGGMLGPITVTVVPGPLTAIAPMDDASNGWIVGHGPGIALLDRGGRLRYLARPESRRPGDTRMNDAACDRQGRLWIGSMDYAGTDRLGQLYCVDEDGVLSVALTGTTISNGIGWSPDGSILYFTDSGPGTVTAYLMETGSRQLRNGRVVVQVSTDEGTPDGLCVDDEGCLWVAIWGGGEVRRYAPDGELLGRVRFPTQLVSSCALGGESRSRLVVTTARRGLSDVELSRQPHAGCLFAVDVAVSGPAAGPYRGPLSLRYGSR